jgi:hypothetical protein
MTQSHRVPTAEYRRLALRWRRLAADATTERARTHLLSLASQCEFLAGDLMPLDAAKPDEAELPDAAG